MPEKKITVVFGATGAQGGGVAHAILQDKKGEFAVRAVIRNPDSDKAKELSKMETEVVAADIDDKDSLNKALAGAYHAYFVNFSGLIFPRKRSCRSRQGSQSAACNLVHAGGYLEMDAA